MSKRTGPTNTVLKNVIHELKKTGHEHSVSLWRRVANDLEKPTRQRRVVNLSSINRHTKENEVVVVPGKVLGTGSLEHKLTISAFQFSGSAREKIKKTGGSIVSLLDLSRQNPKGKDIRILG